MAADEQSKSEGSSAHSETLESEFENRNPELEDSKMSLAGETSQSAMSINNDNAETKEPSLSNGHDNCDTQIPQLGLSGKFSQLLFRVMIKSATISLLFHWFKVHGIPGCSEIQ